MKILHISTGFPLSFQGGITNYVRSLALSQVKMNHNIYVMCDNDSNPEDNIKYYFLNSKIKRFTYAKLIDNESLLEIEKFLKRENFDIIHIHMVLGIDWNLYKILQNYNYIVSLHDYNYLCPKIEMIPKTGEICRYYDELKCKKCLSLIECNPLGFKLTKKLQNYIKNENIFPRIQQNVTKMRFEKFKLLLENANFLLPVSYRVKQIYEDSNIKGNYQVVHIGNISADNFRDSYEYNESPHMIKLLFLGRLSYNKGLDVLIRISDMIDKEKFEIHFYGNDAGFSDLLKKHNIVNHGKYIQSNLPSILKDFDMGMVLSIWEDNGPQVVMELLNNHIPVIGTKMGGISDFVNMDNGYIFDPYSDEEFKNLSYFLDNLTIHDISKLKKNIKRTKTTQEHFDEIEDIYKKVLGE